MVGASAFEPPASWYRTRGPAYSLLSTVRYLTLQSATYQGTIESRGTLHSAVVGTVLGTALSPNIAGPVGVRGGLTSGEVRLGGNHRTQLPDEPRFAQSMSDEPLSALSSQAAQFGTTGAATGGM